MSNKDDEKVPEGGRSSTSDQNSASEPPDGGILAWSQALVGHLVAFNSWGFINSFGVFQSYYESSLQQTSSAISWVGAIQTFLTLFIGTFSGRMMDGGHYRYAAIAGIALQLLGVFTTSAISKYWQLLLAQGICQGLGNGLIFTPTVTLVATYFSTKRSIAVACMTSGTATGGVIFPIIAQRLLARIGIAWTVRTMGLVILFNSSIILTLARARKLPSSRGPLVDWSAFREVWYSSFGLGLFLALMGLYYGYYYVALFAEDVVHFSQSGSFLLLVVMNAMGLIGRIVPGILADRFVGPLNMLIVLVFLSGVMTFVWIAVTSAPGLWIVAILYGIFAAGIQSMFPPALANMEKDMSHLGVRMGMIFSITSVGCLIGTPIAGALVGRMETKYLYAQAFAGATLTGGGLVLLIPRILQHKQGLERLSKH